MLSVRQPVAAADGREGQVDGIDLSMLYESIMPMKQLQGEDGSWEPDVMLEVLKQEMQAEADRRVMCVFVRFDFFPSSRMPDGAAPRASDQNSSGPTTNIPLSLNRKCGSGDGGFPPFDRFLPVGGVCVNIYTDT